MTVVFHRFLSHRLSSAPIPGQKMINDGLDSSIMCGKVVVKPGIRSFTRDDVIFADFTRALKVDAVIFATGYEHSFPFLTPAGQSISHSVIPLDTNSVSPF